MSNVRTAADAMRRLEELAAEIIGKKTDPSAEARKQAEAYNAAFWEIMHTGMTQDSLKVGSDGAGGYLVPDTYEGKLVQSLAGKNVLRQISRTIQTSHRMISPWLAIWESPTGFLKTPS